MIVPSGSVISTGFATRARSSTSRSTVSHWSPAPRFGNEAPIAVSGGPYVIELGTSNWRFDASGSYDLNAPFWSDGAAKSSHPPCTALRTVPP